MVWAAVSPKVSNLQKHRVVPSEPAAEAGIGVLELALLHGPIPKPQFCPAGSMP